jgi:hypothetical protein
MILDSKNVTIADLRSSLERARERSRTAEAERDRYTARNVELERRLQAIREAANGK